MITKPLCGALALVLVFPSFLGAADFQEPFQPAIQPTIQADAASPAPTTSLSSDPAKSSVDFLSQTSALSAPLAQPQTVYSTQALIDTSLSYFDSANLILDQASGYPVEGFRQRDFTQPTAVGFYALLLANVISGDIVSSHITASDAKTKLGKVLDSLLTDQKNLGYKGLLPWMSFNGTSRARRPGEFGEQVTLGDNANLSSALGAAWGALAAPSLSGDATASSLKTKIDTFLDRQKTGYTYLYDASSGKFRRGWNFVRNDWVGGAGALHDYFGDEFRGGILFLALRYGFSDSVYTKLQADVKSYTLQDGSQVQTYAMWDGGAFQWLWPSLTMPETEDPYLNSALGSYVRAAIDFSKKNNLPGFLSASYSGIDTYADNAGMSTFAVNPYPRNESVTSLYGIGAARPFASQEIDAFLNEILNAHPDLISSHGLWEGIDGSGQVVQEQITANVTSFVLGMAGTGSANMKRYLNSKGFYKRLQSIYDRENNVDLIAASTSAFSWSDAQITTLKNGSQYQITTSNFSSIGTAFIENGVHLSGQKVRLKYRSSQDIPAVHLELKERGVYSGVELRHQTADIVLPATGGVDREISFEIPAGLNLSRIDEVLLILSGGTGQALDFTAVSLESAPSNIQDLIRDSAGNFSWGTTVTGFTSGDEYTVQAASFTSSGTAFTQNGVNASGAELRIRYKSNVQVRNVKFEFKERTASGLVIRQEIYAQPFQNTSGQEKEMVLTLPVTAGLGKIDEIVMLLSGGNSGALNLTITDLDLRRGESLDLLTASANQITWGDNGVSGAFSGEDFQLSSSSFYSSGTAFIQPDSGVNVSGKKMVFRYRSTTSVGNVQFEFKTRVGNDLVIQYVTEPLSLQNTGGQEKEFVVTFPEKVELFKINEVVMLIGGGSGQGLDLKVTGLEISPRNGRDLISQSTSLTTASTKTGSTVSGTKTGDDYAIRSSKFYSSSTVISQPAADISGLQLRIRFKSTTAVGNLKLEFRERLPTGGYRINYTSPSVVIPNTLGAEQEMLISLPATTSLSSINEIALLLSGGTGIALDLTILDLEIL